MQQPEIISKLVALYNGTTNEHEKSNTYDKLEKYCRKYNIDIDEVINGTLDEQIQHRGFKHEGTWGLKLAVQVDSLIRGKSKIFEHTRNKRKVAYLRDCSLTDWITFQEWYTHYCNEYRRQYLEMRETFFLAFIHKNELFGKVTAKETSNRIGEENPDDKPKEKQYTPQQLAKMRAMMNGIDSSSPMKQIGDVDFNGTLKA